jgi:hypothetical protein
VDEFKLKVQGIATTSDMAREEMARPTVQAAASKAAGKRAPQPAPMPTPAEITRFGS